MRDRVTTRRQAREGIVLLLAIVAVMWLLEAINSVDHNALDNSAGLIPRDTGRLWTIFSSPFLHASFYPHLIDNTIPLLFMGAIIALRGARRLALVTLVVIVVGGLGTWLISPAGTITIGASGLVFGYATYLLARGLFNRSALELAVGLIVGVVWGGALVASIVPHAGVSWQAHVCGALGGLIAAGLFARPRERAARSRPSADRLGGGELHAALDRANAPR
jgi:membrane associated rhomboid family serine protease